MPWLVGVLVCFAGAVIVLLVRSKSTAPMSTTTTTPGSSIQGRLRQEVGRVPDEPKDDPLKAVVKDTDGETDTTTTTTTTSKDDEPISWQGDGKLLALLYPPGLMGGYRNQVIRFLALCLYGLNNDIPYLFLPSLMWVTQVKVDDSPTEVWVPVPFDLLFDVEHWNAHADGTKLPQLVDYDDQYDGYDCWTREPEITDAVAANMTLLQKQVLQRGVLTPIANRSVLVATRQEVINPRRVDLFPEVKDCKQPVVYGGGTSAGKLWNDYLSYQIDKNRNRTKFGKTDAALLQALQPNEKWRNLAMSCVEEHVHHQHASYVALHARVELEMMDHTCGSSMEKNLTRIFDMVEDLITNEELDDTVQGVFVAVSRSGMELTEGAWYTKHKAYADENIQTLNRAVGKDAEPGQGLGDSNLPVFECGEKLMEKYYRENPDSIDYGSVVQSMVNFYIATAATAFVGVRGSSYSTDIWTTRYHQAKGHSNYEYTPKGIVAMVNDGLPPAHTNCKKIM